jgi:hypothetical protein
MKKLNLVIFLLITSIFLQTCGSFEKIDQRDRPDGAKAKARKNIEEGRGTSLGGLLKGRGGGNFEFSSSNPMWRATLETLDFLPLTTVDYSGGMIITDWYSDSSDKQKSIKITVRFLSNTIRSDSLKIIIHQKTCLSNSGCSTNLLERSKIKEELYSVILRKASLLEKELKKKK